MHRGKVCVVSVGNAITPLKQLLTILNELTETVYFIHALLDFERLPPLENVRQTKVHRESAKFPLGRVLSYLLMQIRFLIRIMEISDETDLFIFSIGGECLLFPILALRAKHKPLLIMPGGLLTRVSAIHQDPFQNLVGFIVNLSIRLATYLVCYSFSLANYPPFSDYRHKTVILHRHFVDFGVFGRHQSIGERDAKIGYIGRLTRVKGVQNLLLAMRFIHARIPNAKLIVCGSGTLERQLKHIVHELGLNTSVDFIGWIPHDEIPKYLNQMRLLVLPSLTEGLPNVILESMACGTPPMATAVGAIPDIIKNDVRGFLLNSTNPAYISERIHEVLSCTKILEEVSENSFEYVRESFSFSRTVEKWRSFLHRFGLVPG